MFCYCGNVLRAMNLVFHYSQLSCRSEWKEPREMLSVREMATNIGCSVEELRGDQALWNKLTVYCVTDSARKQLSPSLREENPEELVLYDAAAEKALDIERYSLPFSIDIGNDLCSKSLCGPIVSGVSTKSTFLAPEILTTTSVAPRQETRAPTDAVKDEFEETDSVSVRCDSSDTEAMMDDEVTVDGCINDNIDIGKQQQQVAQSDSVKFVKTRRRTSSKRLGRKSCSDVLSRPKETERTRWTTDMVGLARTDQ